MGDVDNFSLDPDDLDAVIADLERTEASLEALTADLEAEMRALHEVWEGLAAQAHAEAHAQVPGSYAEYTKVIDEAGNTVKYIKTTYGPDGKIIHIKDKLGG